MDDDNKTNLSSLWIDWTERIISFHETIGYERLDFASKNEKLGYAIEKCSHGFRIQ